MKTLATYLALLCAMSVWGDNTTYTYDDAGRLTTVTYANGTAIAYSYDKAGNLLGRSVTSQASSPQIGAGGIVNAASSRAPLTRGSLATIFGTGLAAGVAGATQVPLPTTLGGVQVTVNGRLAPLFYVSPSQINFQVPFEAPITGSVPVVVMRDGAPPASQNAAMAEYAPGVFTYARTATALDPVIVHANNQLVTPANPAGANEVLIVYATGAGSFDRPPASGAASVPSPLANSLVTPTATLGGSKALVLFSGLTPGSVGLLQINIQLPSSLPAGTSLPLAIAFGNSTAPAVNLSVR